jgi:Autotransporter beta-domain
MKKIIRNAALYFFLSAYSFTSFASVITYSPTGGIFTANQNQDIYWDMTSSSIGLSPSGSYVGGFSLSGHGDFHWGTGSNMVVSSADIGRIMTAGEIVSSSNTFSINPWAWTTTDAGGSVSPSSSPIFFGLKFTNSGSTYYGFVKFIEDAGTQSIVCWGYESVAGNAVTITNCSSGGSSSVDLASNAYALRSVYNIQSAALNAGLSYDCNVFDKEGLCLSTGGRYSTTNSPQSTTTSGLLIGSYKYDKNIRLGAWVDQNLSTQNADGIKLSNNEPLFGVFGVWAERNDGLGYEVKVSAGYGDKDVTVTRTSTNEGSSKINSRGLQTVSSYGIALDSDWIAAPYVGVKYVSLKRGAYTESGSDGLTYDNLRQESTSVIAGVKFTGKIDPQTFTVLSAGVEQDLSNNIGEYSAGSSNTTAFNSNVQKTRPVVSAGVYYDIDKTQRLGLNAIHRQEAFQSTATTSALATYTVGF